MLNTVFRFNKLALAFCLLVIAVFCFFLNKVIIVNDFKSFYEKTDSSLLEQEKLAAIYPEFDTLIVLLSWPEPYGEHPDQLLAFFDLQQQLKAIPHAVDVISVQSVIVPQSNSGSLDFTHPLDDFENLGKPQQQQAWRDVVDQPGVQGILLSYDQKIAAAVVQMDLIGPRDDAVKAVELSMQAIESKWGQQYPNSHLYVLGSVAFQYGAMNEYQRDVLFLAPLILLFGGLILLYLSRSFSALIAGNVVVLGSMLVTGGISGLWGVTFNQTSILAFALVFIIGLADSIHVITQFLLRLSQGDTKSQAVKESLYFNAKPMILTSVTTALGFLSLNFVASPPFAVLGNVTALGVMVALLFSFLALPALLLYLPFKAHKLHQTLPGLSFFVAKKATQYPRFILCSVFVCAVVAAFFLQKNTFNNDEINYYQDGTKTREAIDATKGRFAGLHSFDVAIKNANNNSINDVVFLNQSNELVEWLRQQPEVTKVESYVGLLKSLNKYFDAKGQSQVPKTEGVANDLLMLYQFALPRSDFLHSFIDMDNGGMKITLVTDRLSNTDLIALQNRIAENMPRWPALQPVAIGGRSLMFAHLGQTIIGSMVLGSLTAMVTITVIILLGLGSVRYGLISLIPNILPAVLVYGIWGLWKGEIDVAASSAFCIGLGIVVDDTIHVMTHYQAFRKQGMSTRQAIVDTLGKAGPALFTTTMVLTVGFYLVSLSGFGPNATIGLMSFMIIGFALVLDFLLLPALLMVVD